MTDESTSKERTQSGWHVALLVLAVVIKAIFF